MQGRSDKNLYSSSVGGGQWGVVANKSSLGGGAAMHGGNTLARGFGGGNILHAQTDEKARDARRAREGNSATGTVIAN
jgi:hypothetical protein